MSEVKWRQWNRLEPTAGSEHVITNSERLRALPDEELFGKMGENSLCKHIQSNVPGWCAEHGSCYDCIQEYLNAPAEETDNERT